MVKNRKRFILIASIIVLIAAFSRLVSLYVDWLFFVETGYRFVFSRVITVELLSGLAFGIFAFLFIFINVRLTNKVRFPTASISINGYTTVSLNTVQDSRAVSPPRSPGCPFHQRHRGTVGGEPL